MAEVKDLDLDLQPLARRVPDLTRASLSAFELTSRCQYAARLLAEADSLSDPARADRRRSVAGRVLRAISPAAYSAEMDRLGAELHDARERQDDRGAWQAIAAMERLERDEPQVPMEDVADQAMAAVMTGIENRVRDLKIPPPPTGNVFSRRNKNRRR